MTQGEELAKLMISDIESATGQTVVDPKPLTSISTSIVNFFSTTAIGVSGDIASKGYVDTIATQASSFSYNQSQNYTDQTEQNLTNYIDSQDALMLTTSVNYTDTSIVNLTTYVDTQDQIILNASTTYTDSVSSEIVNNMTLQSVTQNGSSSNKTITLTNPGTGLIIEGDFVVKGTTYQQNVIAITEILSGSQIVGGGLEVNGNTTLGDNQNDINNFIGKTYYTTSPTSSGEITNKDYVDNRDNDVLSFSTSYTNNASASLVNYILNPNIQTIKFDTSIEDPPHTKGLLFYDKSKEALSYYNENSDVMVNLGQEMLIRVKNETGSTIFNGSVVYPIGVSDGNVLIDLANSHEKDKCRLVGVVTTDIPNNTIGYVTKIGEVGGLDTSSFLTGNILYLSNVPGQLTNIKPTGSSYITQIAAVKTISPTAGSIVVDINTSELTVEVAQSTGWSLTHDATISVTETSSGAIVNINPTGTEFDFYQYGDKYSKSFDSVQLPDQEGLYVVYYNLGTLFYLLNPTNAQVASIIQNNPTVTYVYWNAESNRAEYVGDELHKIGTMSGDAHVYTHFVLKCRYLNGLSPNNVIVDGSGNINSSAQFGMDSGMIADEDLIFSTATISPTAGLPIAYLSGSSTSPTLRTTASAGFSVLTASTGLLAYNTIVGGNYQLVSVSNGNFVCYHVIAVNENNINKRVISFVGQAEYTTIATAQAGAQTEIENLRIVGILPQEVKAIATFIFETKSAFSNTVQARIRSTVTGASFVDFRNVQIAGVAGGSSTQSTIFQDSTFQIYNTTDVTKISKFDLSAVSTATTRTLTVPNKNGTIAIDADVVHLTGTESISGNKTFLNQVDMNNNNIINVLTPISSGSAANKYYVDTMNLALSASLGDLIEARSGGNLQVTLQKGNSAGIYQIDMNGNKIINVATPTLSGDAANKSYVDTQSLIVSGNIIGYSNYLYNQSITYSNSASANAYLQSVAYTNTASASLINYIDTRVASITGSSGGSGSAVITGTLGETVTAGQPVYQSSIDGKWYLGQAIAGKITGLSICKIGGNTGEQGTFVRYGTITGISGLISDSELYVSQSVAGALMTEPTSGISIFVGTSRGTTELDVEIGIIGATIASTDQQMVVTETPTPSANGITNIFSVSMPYFENTLQLYYNGQRLTQGIDNDYVESFSTGTFTFTFIPSAASTLSATFLPIAAPFSRYVYGENCSTQIVSGGETNFTTLNDYVGNSLSVYYNGLRLKQLDDYVLSGSNAFTMSFATSAGSNLIVDYESTKTEMNAYKVYCTSDIEVLDYSKGLILHSPSGYRYRITVNDVGTLSTTSVT